MVVYFAAFLFPNLFLLFHYIELLDNILYCSSFRLTSRSVRYHFYYFSVMQGTSTKSTEEHHQNARTNNSKQGVPIIQ